MQQTGKIVVIVGLILVVIGLVLYFAGNKFQWFGNLPGDIRIERENFRFYFPITTMILVSAAISFVAWIIQKLR